MANDKREQAWTKWERDQLGDWSDVSHRQSFDAGHAAAKAEGIPQVDEIAQLKADLATAKQGLEHYADIENWDDSACVDESGKPFMTTLIVHIGESINGYDLAQQTLDTIGKESNEKR